MEKHVTGYHGRATAYGLVSTTLPVAKSALKCECTSVPTNFVTILEIDHTSISISYPSLFCLRGPSIDQFLDEKFKTPNCFVESAQF